MLCEINDCKISWFKNKKIYYLQGLASRWIDSAAQTCHQGSNSFQCLHSAAGNTGSTHRLVLFMTEIWPL